MVCGRYLLVWVLLSDVWEEGVGEPRLFVLWLFLKPWKSFENLFFTLEGIGMSGLYFLAVAPLMVLIS